MALSLSVDTREAFEKSKSALGSSGLELARLARASANDASGERDRLLEAIVMAYREGDRQAWSAVLLDVLTPAILKKLRGYRPEPPGIELIDVRNQFLLELLDAAAGIPLPSGARFLERRLILRAGQGVRRWLEKETRWRAACQPLECLIEEGTR